MTRGFMAYERPMWAHLTTDSESSSLLKTPTATENLSGRPKRFLTYGPDRRFDLTDQIAAIAMELLPTPAVNDMGAGKTVDAWDAWDAWTEAMQAKHGNGNGHGKSLAIETLRIGVSTPPRLPAGHPSLDVPRLPLQSQDPKVTSDSLLDLLSGCKDSLTDGSQTPSSGSVATP